MLDYLEELADEREDASGVPADFADYVARLPGINETGELGIVFNADDEDDDEV